MLSLLLVIYSSENHFIRWWFHLQKLNSNIFNSSIKNENAAGRYTWNCVYTEAEPVAFHSQIENWFIHALKYPAMLSSPMV